MPKISSRPTFTHPVVGYQKSDQPSGGNKKKTFFGTGRQKSKKSKCSGDITVAKANVTAAV